MPRIDVSASTAYALALVVMLLGACAQGGGPAGGTAGAPATAQESAAQAESAMAEDAEEPEQKIDPMADVSGDKPLPPLQGATERIDCATGSGDHHRIGLEARGGQVTYVTYYNKWRTRTCSMELARDKAGNKWRLASDGATRVQTPHGIVLVRARPDSYIFEFQQVSRQPYCGTPGEITGTLTVSRGAARRVCTVKGFSNTGG